MVSILHLSEYGKHPDLVWRGHGSFLLYRTMTFCKHNHEAQQGYFARAHLGQRREDVEKLASPDMNHDMSVALGGTSLVEGVSYLGFALAWTMV